MRKIDRPLIKAIQKKIDKEHKDPSIEIVFDYTLDYLKKINNPYLHFDPNFFNQYINVVDEQGDPVDYGSVTLLEGFRSFCKKVCKKYYDHILAKEKEDFLSRVPDKYKNGDYMYMYIEGKGLSGMIEDIIEKKFTNRMTQEDLDNFTSTFTK